MARIVDVPAPFRTPSDMIASQAMMAFGFVRWSRRPRS
jgi:hypothetical protein